MPGCRESAALVIAGSDPSGSAGIQADIKTFTALGIYCGAAVTCLTVQNTSGVLKFSPVSVDLLTEQIQAVLDDLDVSHVKIGMVGPPSAAEVLGKILDGFAGEICYDPVLASTSGSPLASAETLDVVRRHLMPRVTVITPNIGELEKISGSKCPDHQSAIQAAVELLEKYINLKAVTVTGGHLDINTEEITDTILIRDLNQNRPVVETSIHRRVKGAEFHGTGCVFASALTAFHMKTGDLKKSFMKASNFMAAVIEKSTGFVVGQKGATPLALHSMPRLKAPHPSD